MSAALAGYLAVTQIAARLDLTLPDDIKTLDKWAPTLDELEAMVCAMTPEEAKACRKRAGLPEVTS